MSLPNFLPQNMPVHHLACLHQYDGNPPYDEREWRFNDDTITDSNAKVITILHPRFCEKCVVARRTKIGQNHSDRFNSLLSQPTSWNNMHQLSYEFGVIQGRESFQSIDPLRLDQVFEEYRAQFAEDDFSGMLRHSYIQMPDEEIGMLNNLCDDYVKQHKITDVNAVASLKHTVLKEYERGRYEGMVRQKQVEENATSNHADNFNVREAALEECLAILDFNFEAPANEVMLGGKKRAGDDDGNDDEGRPQKRLRRQNDTYKIDGTLYPEIIKGLKKNPVLLPPISDPRKSPATPSPHFDPSNLLHVDDGQGPCLIGDPGQLVAQFGSLAIGTPIPVPIFERNRRGYFTFENGRTVYVDLNGTAWTHPPTDVRAHPWHPNMDDPSHPMFYVQKEKPVYVGVDKNNYEPDQEDEEEL